MASKEVNESVRPLTLRDTETGEEFVLEFSRESVVFAENHGFDLDDVTRFPMTKVPELFYYAFRKNHKNISRERTNRILFEDLGGVPDGMVERLAALYSVPFEVLATTGDSERKNARMTVEF